MAYKENAKFTMKNIAMKTLITWIIILFSLPLVIAQSEPNNLYVDTIPFLNYKYNVIQYYNPLALTTFNNNWNSKNKKIVIATLGDSHLQNEIYPSSFRKELLKRKGDGGKGFMFNYSAAETYGSDVYKSTYSGKWTSAKSRYNNPKLPIGFSGMTLNTTDVNATLTFKFNEILEPQNYILKVYLNQSKESFKCKIETEHDSHILNVNENNADLPYIKVALKMTQTIKISLIRTSSNQYFFEYYGMSLENTTDTGVIVHNAGVGAAQYNSILKENLFDSQIESLNPSLVIVDFGTNDFLYDDSVKPDLEVTIKQVVSKIRTALPNASIVLVTAMDMQYKGKPLKSEAEFVELIYKIAKEENLGVYDWYNLAGGNNSINLFLNERLAQPDKIHLTSKGYKLKGKLLAYALLNSLSYLQNKPKDSLIVK
jgi:lysophospholipase L1-like esterase